MRTPRLMLALLCLWAASAVGTAGAEGDDERWSVLRTSLFGDRTIHDGVGVVGLEAPYRAHDAAIVPITVRAEIPQRPERYIRTITLIIDKNPAPLAGVFRLSPRNGLATISTRIRVNEYTYVRAVAETNDGSLFMARKFVKASGGCSAPAGKDPEAALARIGKMRLRQLGEAGPNEPAQSQLLISHPNSTGMQMDQLTRHYIPAHFVTQIEVRYGEEVILEVQSNISLSEDPSLHFHYLPGGAADISVKVVDTKGETYTRSWPATTATGS